MRLIVLFFAFTIVNAVVPVVDVEVSYQDKQTIVTYLTNIEQLIDKMTKTSKIAEQVINLKKLVEVQNKVFSLCKNVCDAKEEGLIRNYLENLDRNITAQFNNAYIVLNDAQDRVRNLKDIIKFMSGLPTNSKQAALALEQSILEVQIELQNTLSQIALLLNQKAQKEEAQKKMDKVVTKSIYTGMKNHGL